nr:Sua5/YciO/YrdC/YwlC family protein [Acinetobacter tandoii]
MITTSVAEAADSLKRGQVLAYPTEAVWGLGCDPYNEAAFNEILKLKQRPIEKGVILLAGHISQVEHLLARLTPEMRDTVIASWSNRSPTERATTWLLPASEDIPLWIKGNHPKVAIRVTTHPLCVALCNAFNGFIVSTSANPAGLEPARSLQEANKYFNHHLIYLNGDLGLSQEPSRILDAETGQIIRA